MLKPLVLSVCLLFAPIIASADDYSTDYSSKYWIASDMVWPPASGLDFGFSSTGSGIWGNCFGFDSGCQTIYSGATSGFYKFVFAAINGGSQRTLALSATPMKVAMKVGPPSATALDQKFQLWGFTNSTALTTQFASGGAGSGAFFRIDAAGSAAVIEAVTKNGASETVTSTGITDTAGVEPVYEVIATSSQVDFIVNGTTVATHTTNITPSAIGPGFGIRTKVAAMRAFRIDWFKFESAR